MLRLAFLFLSLPLKDPGVAAVVDPCADVELDNRRDQAGLVKQFAVVGLGRREGDAVQQAHLPGHEHLALSLCD